MTVKNILALAGVLFIALGSRASWSGETANKPPANWIEREKIRAGWIYHSDGIEQIERFKKEGMNALITSAASAENFDKWARESRRAGMHLFGVLGFSFDAQKAGVAWRAVRHMRRAVFGNGYESVVACPTDEAFWQQEMTAKAVALAREGMTADKEISGILIDFELYANDKTGQIYYTDACYCDHCFGDFLKHKGVEDASKQVPFAERVKWLKDRKLFEEYHPFLQGQVRALAVKMREAVEAVRKDFFLGFYPRPHNWMLVGVAQGIGTAERPMVLWATDTYGGGGPSKIPNWREEMEKQDIHCYYCAGMLLRFYSAANLAANMVGCSMKGAGYWLFTVHTLCVPEEQQSGDYYLSAGTPQDYLGEIRRADGELDKWSADQKNYKTGLALVEEPVRYRQVGFDVGRFKVPAVVDKSEAAHSPVALPPLPLVGSQYLVMCLKEGTEAAVRFQVARSKSADVWGVSYAVLDPDKQVVSTGKMPPGEDFTVKFKAVKAGVHTIALSPGYYGRCTAAESSVPFALSTQGSLEVASPGGKVYFFVPEGVADFELSAQCKNGSGTAQLTVYDPDGAVALEQETDPYLHSASLKAPTAGKAGRLWSLAVGRVPKKGFGSVLVSFDKRLPPVVTLSPAYVFASQK